MRKLYLLILLFISFFALSQTPLPSTNQLWTRFQVKYEHPSFISTSQIENRYDFNTYKSFMQFRSQITTAKKLKLGAGITYRDFGNNEIRPYQIVQYEIHRLWVEERIFNNGIKYRIRYQIYPEFKLNELNKINVGLEYMIQGTDFKHYAPEQTRYMLDYTMITGDNSKITVGYMLSSFNTFIIHSFRLTTEIGFKKKLWEKQIN
jgi:hypothetical protein